MYPDIEPFPPNITLLDVLDAEFAEDLERDLARRARRQADIEYCESKLNYRRMC